MDPRAWKFFRPWLPERIQGTFVRLTETVRANPGLTIEAAIIVAMGYSLTPDLVKLAEARAWKRQRAELNAAVVARRVKS